MPNYTLTYTYPEKPNLPFTQLQDLSNIELGDYLVYDKSYQYYNELSFLEVKRITDKYVGFQKSNGIVRHLYPGKIQQGCILTNRPLRVTVTEVLKKQHHVALLKAGAQLGDGRVDNTK